MNRDPKFQLSIFPLFNGFAWFNGCIGVSQSTSFGADLSKEAVAKPYQACA